MKLTGALEENILTGLGWSERIAPQIALKITLEDFSTRPYRRIAEAALDFLNRHHRPARVHLGDILEHDIRRGEDGKTIGVVLEEMKRLAPALDEEYVMGELDHFLDLQRLTNAVNTASDLLTQGELDKAREALRQPELLPTPDGVWLRDTESWLRFMREEEDQDLFSCGVEALDERGVRPARGEMFVLLGAAGTGKSWFLTNVGKHNVLDERKNVLHISLENSLDITLQRYTQSLLSLTRDEGKTVQVRLFSDPNAGGTARLQRPVNPTRVEPAPVERESLREVGRHELARRLEPYQRRGQLLVKYFPTGMLTLGMLTAYLDALEHAENFKPDLIILDYLTLMNLTGRDLRVAIGQLTRNLRGLAGVRNCALVTVVQANRAARTADLVTTKHVAEDWSIVATADTFITYSQTLHERERGLARLLIDKARNSTDKWLAGITQAYEIGQFALDSYYFSNALRQDFETDPDAVDD